MLFWKFPRYPGTCCENFQNFYSYLRAVYFKIFEISQIIGYLGNFPVIWKISVMTNYFGNFP